MPDGYVLVVMLLCQPMTSSESGYREPRHGYERGDPFIYPRPQFEKFLTCFSVQVYALLHTLVSHVPRLNQASHKPLRLPSLLSAQPTMATSFLHMFGMEA